MMNFIRAMDLCSRTQRSTDIAVPENQYLDQTTEDTVAAFRNR